MEIVKPKSQVQVQMEEKEKTRLAVDKVKPWLTENLCPWYYKDLTKVSDFGLIGNLGE